MSESDGQSRKVAIIRLSILVSIVVGLLVVGLLVGPDRIGEVFDSISGSLWGAVAFVFLYAALTMLMAPGAVSSIAGGAIFGFFAGFGLVLLGATLGAVGAFYVSRRVGQDSMQALLGNKTKSLDGWIEENGFVAVLLLRLLPIVPFNILNYAAGLTPVDGRRYTIATFLGIIPGVGVFVSIGSSASEPTGPRFVLSLVALAALVVVGSVGAKRMQKKQGSSSLASSDA